MEISSVSASFIRTPESMAGLAGAIIADVHWTGSRALSDTKVCRCSLQDIKWCRTMKTASSQPPLTFQSAVGSIRGY